MENPIAVLGGGIVGTAIAYTLSEQGVPCILVERDHILQGASACSFASVSAMDEPITDLYLLKCRGMDAWRIWDKELNLGVSYRREGEIRWAESTAGAADLESLVAQARGRGYPVRRIGEGDLKRRLPEARPGRVLAASSASEDAVVEPLGAIKAALGRFKRNGGRCIHGRAAIGVADDGLELVVHEKRIPVSTLVVAAGAETPVMFERLGWDIPMIPSPGLLVRTTPVEPIARQIVYVSPESGPAIHLRQDDDGRVTLGERSQDWIAQNPTREHAEDLLEQATRFWPALSGVEVERFMLEWRPMPADGLPIIGRAPGFPGLYVAAMHSGVTLAPAVGELVAKELTKNIRVSPLAPFRLERFDVRELEVVRDVDLIFESSPEVFLG
jgi:glycine/D-amino acid oxidase-like deaminating enzyme